MRTETVDPEYQTKLVRHVVRLISMADKGEDARRKSDRVGGNLYYGKHWNVAVASSRSALVVNLSKALIDHKISIMTKQRPLPVIEATDVGDEESARLMRSCIMQWWDRDRMQRKLEQALFLANTTRSSAIKVLWDSTLNDRAGDITCDVIPGWRLIVDPRTTNPKRMQYAGDRATMTRSRAMLLYPQAAARIQDAPSATDQGPQANAVGRGSPLRDPWQKLSFDTSTTGIVNGTPTLFSGGGPNHPSGIEEMVEVAEVYLKDHTLVEKMQPKKHPTTGQVLQKPTMDAQGMPQFREIEPTKHVVDGFEIHTPNFELVMEDVLEPVQVFKYPHWRRVTVMLDGSPDSQLLEDVAWDFPLPYAFVHDGQALEGFWVKGSILDLETLQGALNVSLSTMLDNLRFSAYRAYIAYNGSLLERTNMNLSPGEIIRAGEKGTIEPLPVPDVSPAWFQWVNFVMSLMERVLGATGIMQGEAAGRVDSAAGYDMLAEIGGSRIVKAAQRMESAISDVAAIVGEIMQRKYTERHAVEVEDATGNVTFERITPGSLLGSFSYKTLTGSSLAWSESSIRARVMEEFNLGLRDKVSVWKAMHIEDWRQIMKRMETLPAQLQPAPPPRTRKSIPAHQHPPKGRRA
jgi:hypothetical protein